VSSLWGEKKREKIWDGEQRYEKNSKPLKRPSNGPRLGPDGVVQHPLMGGASTHLTKDPLHLDGGGPGDSR